MNDFPRLLDENDVASSIGVSVRALRRWHALRKGPPRIKIGRKIHYREPSVREWLEGSETADAR